ncbi:hypothetical protein FHR22_004502 [Sphingopyxis panaciterrae]|uniref:hypothetical protein n=1 Tax=Sphingopyxis panaciterrae TaxID=363841 RepID=UPI00141EBE0C|nr:hypothetical protein [Sphingopyxis panaciterrae]NIJ39743.1 hypothetical protein [Sphingopyxis panaciterrae]
MQVTPQTREGWIATARFVIALILVQSMLLGIAFSVPRWSSLAAAMFVVATLTGAAAFYRWSWERSDKYPTAK